MTSFDIIFEWIPYDELIKIKEIGKSGLSTAIWREGPLYYDRIEKEWMRNSYNKVVLKYLSNSQNLTDEFLSKATVTYESYGISQNPNTKDYIMVLEYAEGGSFDNYLDKNYERFDWFNGLKVLTNIINGLSKIHQEQMVHRDFHIGNILITKNEILGDFHIYSSHENNNDIDNNDKYNACISDMGLCRKIDDIDETSIYGVMPYVAPEVLRGKPYTRAADIYSFGMVMHVVATGRQPFDNCAHDEVLVLNICNGIRPEINEKIAPKCYIDLMKRCWDLNPENRPNSIEVKEIIE
ncbi:kinase-like domain-containing protein, partial [Rhizophagus diaphanus]